MIDASYKLIRKIKISTASEHDTLHFEEVIGAANTGHHTSDHRNLAATLST